MQHCTGAGKLEQSANTLQNTYSSLGQPGIPAVRGLKALLLQFWEDYADRQMEAAVRENLAIEAVDKIKVFIKDVLTWQIRRKDIDSDVTPLSRVIKDPEVDALFNRYVADLNLLNARRSETSSTRFQAFRLRHTIPMLIYAMEIPGGGSRGLVYLGEADALARGTKTGGFISEDSRIVEVLMDQIWTENPSDGFAYGSGIR